jgi:hypothetical protein
MDINSVYTRPVAQLDLYSVNTRPVGSIGSLLFLWETCRFSWISIVFMGDI